MKKINLSVILLSCFALTTMAQTGGAAAGLNTANTELAAMSAPAWKIVLTVGGLVGLVGAVKVYSKWHNHDPDTQKALVGWVGACLFLIITGLVLKAFFGVQTG
jgi:hypothetical protein